MYTNEIICGESSAVLAGFESGCVDLVVTDPPYLGRYRDRLGRGLANDDDPEAVLSVFDQVYRVMKSDSYCISFYGWVHLAGFAAAWDRAGFRTVGHIVWPKPYASKVSYTEYRHESTYVLAKGNPAKPAHPLPDVLPWEYTGNKAHPTEKAVSVIAPLIECFSRPGDLVLDPFSGSGTTAVAAALNDRRYIGIELEEAYCRHAKRRLAGVERHLEMAA